MVMKSIAEVERLFDELEKLPLLDVVEILKNIGNGPDAHIVLTSGRFRKWAFEHAHMVILED
jgi:hypothetical protein